MGTAHDLTDTREYRASMRRMEAAALRRAEIASELAAEKTRVAYANDDGLRAYRREYCTRRIILVQVGDFYRGLVAFENYEDAAQEWPRLASFLTRGDSGLLLVSDRMAANMAACGYASWM